MKQLAIIAHCLNVDTVSLELRCLKLLDMSQYVRADAKGILSAEAEYLSNPGSDLPAIPLEENDRSSMRWSCCNDWPRKRSDDKIERDRASTCCDSLRSAQAGACFIPAFTVGALVQANGEDH